MRYEWSIHFPFVTNYTLSLALNTCQSELGSKSRINYCYVCLINKFSRRHTFFLQTHQYKSCGCASLLAWGTPSSSSSSSLFKIRFVHAALFAVKQAQQSVLLGRSIIIFLFSLHCSRLLLFCYHYYHLLLKNVFKTMRVLIHSRFATTS